jgi:hypothetical protein
LTPPHPLTFTVQRQNPNAPCNVGEKSTQCFVTYRRLQCFCCRHPWEGGNYTLGQLCPGQQDFPSLKVWVENSPTLHGKGY